MRSFGLLNLAYGTTGITSANFLNNTSGMMLSLWIIIVGAAFFLGIVPKLKSVLALVRNACLKKV